MHSALNWQIQMQINHNFTINSEYYYGMERRGDKPQHPDCSLPGKITSHLTNILEEWSKSSLAVLVWGRSPDSDWKPSQSSQFEHSALFRSGESANIESSSCNVDHCFASELQKIVSLKHTMPINPKYPPRFLSSLLYATLLNEESRSKIWRCFPIAAILWSGHLRSYDRPDVVGK